MPRILLLIPVLALALTGCSDDFTNPSGDTGIQGHAVLSGSREEPIFDLGLGVFFKTELVTGAPGTPGLHPAAAPGAVAARIDLGAPYPNPLAQGDVTVMLSLAEDVVGVRVEVVATARTLPGTLSLLHDGALSKGEHTYVWDGVDELVGDAAPNGLYRIRALVKDVAGKDSLAAQRSVLINRSVGESRVLRAYNTYTDPDGFYRISDIPVGEVIEATNATGGILGTRLIREDLTLFNHDIDYRQQETAVRVPPGTVVTVDLFFVPAATPPIPISNPPAAD